MIKNKKEYTNKKKDKNEESIKKISELNKIIEKLNNDIKKKNEEFNKYKNKLELNIKDLENKIMDEKNNYNEKIDEYFKNIKKLTNSLNDKEEEKKNLEKQIIILNKENKKLFGSKNQKKKNKIPKIPIYHLYKNRDRIIQLKQKQINYFIQNNKKIPEKIDEDPNISDGLNPQEYKELKSLLDTGFPNWERKEYEAFLASLDFIPKDDIEKIAKEIPTKTFEEVKAYCETFWGRIDEFTDGQRIMKNIEKKERMEKQRQQSSMLIAKKCQGIEDGEYEEIKIAFPTNNHQSEYTYEEDQYLIYITYKYGYGNWDEIMKKIKTSEDLLFNYFLKSRNKIEIQKRIDYLVKIIEKEYNPNTTNEKGSWKKNKIILSNTSKQYTRKLYK